MHLCWIPLTPVPIIMPLGADTFPFCAHRKFYFELGACLLSYYVLLSISSNRGLVWVSK